MGTWNERVLWRGGAWQNTASGNFFNIKSDCLLKLVGMKWALVVIIIEVKHASPDIDSVYLAESCGPLSLIRIFSFAFTKSCRHAEDSFTVILLLRLRSVAECKQQICLSVVVNSPFDPVLQFLWYQCASTSDISPASVHQFMYQRRTLSVPECVRPSVIEKCLSVCVSCVKFDQQHTLFSTRRASNNSTDSCNRCVKGQSTRCNIPISSHCYSTYWHCTLPLGITISFPQDPTKMPTTKKLPGCSSKHSSRATGKRAFLFSYSDYPEAERLNTKTEPGRCLSAATDIQGERGRSRVRDGRQHETAVFLFSEVRKRDSCEMVNKK